MVSLKMFISVTDNDNKIFWYKNVEANSNSNKLFVTYILNLLSFF